MCYSRITCWQTEVLNRYLEQYLRAFVAEHPKKWGDYIVWAEYHYNTSFHSAIGMTSFQAFYERPPPKILAYVGGTSPIQVMDDSLSNRNEILHKLRHNLLQAQNRMKQIANKHRRDVQFKVGDLVMVRLQPYRQSTVAKRLNSKLCCRYFGPFPIIAHAGLVAYTLQLPPDRRIHPTFHVSLLKAYKGDHSAPCYPLPELSQTNKPIIALEAILSSRVITIQGKKEKQILVKWSHSPTEAATWEEL